MKTQFTFTHSHQAKIVFALLAAALLVSALVMVAAASETVSIGWQALSGGAGRASGGAITLDGTLGQPVTGVSSAGSAWLGAGYWAAEQPVQLYLPVLRR